MLLVRFSPRIFVGSRSHDLGRHSRKQMFLQDIGSPSCADCVSAGHRCADARGDQVQVLRCFQVM